MTGFFKIFKRIPTFIWLSVLSGICIGTSYIPFNGWALLFSYIPLWIATLKLYQANQSYKKIFFAGWMTQFILTLIGFNWIYYMATEFGHLPGPLAAATLILYAAAMHIYIPLSLVFGIWIIKRFHVAATHAQFLFLALALALLERAWPSIFEWNLAYTLLWIQFPLYQWADVVGFWGLSTWLLIFQALLGSALVLYQTNKQRAIFSIASILTVIGALSISGAYKGKAWAATDSVVKIGVAQGNIGNAEKVLSEKKYQYHSYIRSLYTNLTSQHLAQHPTDIMIWPETAMPFGLDQHFHHNYEQKSLLQSIQNWGVPIITGGYSQDAKKKDHLGSPLIRNAIFYFSPHLNFSDQPYFKTNLLVFGEYMPMGEQFPFLYKLLPFVGVYEKGSGPIVAKVTYKETSKETPKDQQKERTLNMGPQVCYDSLYPSFSRGLAQNGAQILFNVTNDAWYGWWSEPFQHQMMTLARGIEVRRPLIRSTNTGFSSAILADGTLLQNSPLDQSWTYTYSIPYIEKPDQSFYTKLGHLDWVVWTLLSGLLIIIYKKRELHVRS